MSASIMDGKLSSVGETVQSARRLSQHRALLHEKSQGRRLETSSLQAGILPDPRAGGNQGFTRNDSRLAPDSSASRSQRGVLPRPDHFSPFGPM